MENNNSVAYTTKINSISPIEGADNIELAQVNGWTSVVQKGTHRVGDLVLCITTDAVIPEELAKLWKVDTYLRKGSRVRTVKLRGVYSECILIPSFDMILNKKFEKSYYSAMKEGLDWMEHFNIYKYEPPVTIIQDSKGRKHKYHQNPNFHVYYKFPNMKNVPDMFNELDLVQITRKLHGTNARYGIVKKNKLSLLDKIRKFFGNKWIEYEYVYGSHNVEKGSDSQGFYSTDVWKTIADKYSIKDALWDFVKETLIDIGAGIVFYGEIYGPGIQGDKYSYGLNHIDLAIFDMTIDNEYMSCETTEHYTRFEIGLQYVPVLYFGKYDEDIVQSLIKDQFIENTKIPHEGIVIKHQSGRRDKVAKVINPDYHIFSEKNNIPDSH